MRIEPAMFEKRYFRHPLSPGQRDVLGKYYPNDLVDAELLQVDFVLTEISFFF